MFEFLSKHKNFFVILFFVLLTFGIYKYISSAFSKVEKQNELLKKDIIQRDSLLKVGEGKYSKLVNYYATKQQLEDSVKKSSPVVFNTIKNNKESVLSNTNANLTFKTETSSQKVQAQSDSVYAFTSYYPEKATSFIKYDGSLNIKSHVLSDKWTFSNIGIKVILTQKQDGLWNTYIDAPEFVKVNSMVVNSLPPASYNNPSKSNPIFKLYGGVGVRTNAFNYNNLTPTINAGISILDAVIVEANFGTDKQFGGGLMIKL